MTTYIIILALILLGLGLLDYLLNSSLRKIVKDIKSDPDYFKSVENRQAVDLVLKNTQLPSLLDPLVVYYRHIIYKELQKEKNAK